MQEARSQARCMWRLEGGRVERTCTVVYPLDDQRLYGADRLTIRGVNRKRRARQSRDGMWLRWKRASTAESIALKAWVVRSKCTEERDSDRSRMDPVHDHCQSRGACRSTTRSVLAPRTGVAAFCLRGRPYQVPASRCTCLQRSAQASVPK
jgi:hypothetical protein